MELTMKDQVPLDDLEPAAREVIARWRSRHKPSPNGALLVTEAVYRQKRTQEILDDLERQFQ